MGLVGTRPEPSTISCFGSRHLLLHDLNLNFYIGEEDQLSDGVMLTEKQTEIRVFGKATAVWSAFKHRAVHLLLVLFPLAAESKHFQSEAVPRPGAGSGR